MCNACGFQCCAWDGFGQCGCDDCDNPACWARCDNCGLYEIYCTCNRDDLDDYEMEVYEENDAEE